MLGYTTKRGRREKSQKKRQDRMANKASCHDDGFEDGGMRMIQGIQENMETPRKGFPTKPPEGWALLIPCF